MGQIFARFLEGLGQSIGDRDLRILMLGLDAAGKTTVLYKLKVGEKISTIPTIGFNVETVNHKNVHFTVWDVGGQQKIRVLWRHYFASVQGLIFVVDTVDKDRVTEARNELHNLMSETELSQVALLVFANKSDLPQSMSVAELTDKLQLFNFTRNKWHIQNCCATSGQGLHEGLDWLSSALKNGG